MAAPPEATVKNLTGKWVMSKALGDDQNDILSLQGIGWLTRKAVTSSTVKLDVKSSEQDGKELLDITSYAVGSSTEEHRIFDWADKSHKDKLFGNVTGRSRFFTSLDQFETVLTGLSESDRKFLLGEETKDGKPSKWEDAEQFIQTTALSNDNGWTVDQVWGFEVLDGARRHTRRVVCQKGDKTVRVRLVYDYAGPL